MQSDTQKNASAHIIVKKFEDRKKNKIELKKKIAYKKTLYYNMLHKNGLPHNIMADKCKLKLFENSFFFFLGKNRLYGIYSRITNAIYSRIGKASFTNFFFYSRFGKTSFKQVFFINAIYTRLSVRHLLKIFL